MSTYASPDDMMLRYDVRRLGQLCTDNDTQLTTEQLVQSAILQEAITDASGLVESAVMVGGRYSVTDLLTLNDNPKRFLARLVCDLTYGFLVSRRGFNSNDIGSLAPGYANALKLLDELRAGTWIFANDAAIEASKPKRVQLSTNVTLVTTEARRFFGEDTNPNGSIYP